MSMTLLKKTTGTLLAVSAIASCSAVFAQAETTVAPDAKLLTTPTVTIIKETKISSQAKAFIKLSSALKMYANKTVMTNVEKITDTTTRVRYTDEVRSLQGKLNLASQLDINDQNAKYSDVIAIYRDIYVSLRNVNKEVSAIVAGGTSPYVLSGTTVKEVEALVLGVQQDLVKQIKTTLDEYKEGIKETGELHFAIKSDKANISMDIEKYVSLYSLMLNQQDMDMKLNIRFDIPANSGAIAQAIKGSIMLDGNMKMSGSALYLTLRDYSITLDNTDANMSAMVAVAKTQMDAYKGKTYRLKVPTEARQPNFMKTIYDVLDVANQQPLLTVKKVSGNDIYLSFKKESFASLQKVLSNDLDLPATASRDIEKINESIIGKLSRNGENFVMTFGNYPQFSAQSGVATLSRTEGSYTATFDLAKAKNAIHLLAKNNVFEFNLKNDDFQINTDWRKDYLNMFVIVPEQGRLDINGVYSRSEGDLSVKWNNAALGYIKGKEVAKNSYTFDVNISLPAPLSAIFQYSGKTQVEYQKVQIEFPTQAIDISVPENE